MIKLNGSPYIKKIGEEQRFHDQFFNKPKIYSCL